MIRPLTIATFLLACGSGLYLYQSKHEVQLLDRTIERTVHDTSALREQSRLLAAEWTMLNDPDRLRQFSDTYLSTRSIAPAQFSSITDLDARLPAPRVEAPPREEPDPADQTAAETASQTAPDASPAPDPFAPATVAEDDLPVPPIPPGPAAPRAPSIVAAAHPADIRPSVAHALVADVKPADPRPFDQRSPEQRVVPRVADGPTDIRPQSASPVQAPPLQAAAPPPRQIALAPPRPPLPGNGPVNGPPPITQSRPQIAATPAPYSGSLLGMARGSMPPAPRPTPVNATYNTN